VIVVFEFNEEQHALRSTTRSFFQAVSSDADLRSRTDPPPDYDASVWQRMATELGLAGLIVPSTLGGSDGTFVDLAIVLEEAGRRLVSSPFLSTMIAAAILLEAGEGDVERELLTAIAAGEVTATFALAERDGRWDASALACRAEGHGTSVAVTGAKNYVVDGDTSDLIIVAAHGAGGVGLFAVEGDAAGVSRMRLSTFDRSRHLAALEFSRATGRALGHLGDAALVERALDLASTALAAEQVGVAQAAFDMALGYARTRVQFGRVIGSFQAIKHMCADLLLDIESARSAAYYAAWTIAERSDEAALVAPLAQAYCSDVALLVASDNIQIHGGIGFTWEHLAHLYYRRAKASLQLFGSPQFHRERLAARLGLCDHGGVT
jgi:alkylation response protein AidB-like acyl-CoA dehydrogenase